MFFFAHLISPGTIPHIWSHTSRKTILKKLATPARQATIPAFAWKEGAA
jgi:hypothetical protein